MMKMGGFSRLARTRLVGTRLRNSLFDLLRRPHPIEGDINGIRSAMLAALGDGTGLDEAQVERKILFASDIEALWYVRSSLMRVIATSRGESHARSSLAKITSMFPNSSPLFRQHKAGIRQH